jgi:hypothetical protein
MAHQSKREQSDVSIPYSHFRLIIPSSSYCELTGFESDPECETASNSHDGEGKGKGKGKGKLSLGQRTALHIRESLSLIQSEDIT